MPDLELLPNGDMTEVCCSFLLNPESLHMS